MGDTTSKTERETSIIEREITGGDHFKTTISDENDTVERRGSTSEDAEKNASDAWDRLKDR
jgi:hypothetical protein